MVSEVFHLRSRDLRDANAPNSEMPRPMPSMNRPPVSVCIVVAYDAVTIGWQVLWFVAAVASGSSLTPRPQRRQRRRLMMLKRSE
jgi:hypothetical protein